MSVAVVLKQKIPAFRQGKHSVRLYAVRTRRVLPGTPWPPKGGERSRTLCRKKDRKENRMKKKTAILTARLTPAEKAAIERKAQQANMTVTDYIVKSWAKMCDRPMSWNRFYPS